jgi:hypothetical protein
VRALEPTKTRVVDCKSFSTNASCVPVICSIIQSDLDARGNIMVSTCGGTCSTTTSYISKVCVVMGLGLEDLVRLLLPHNVPQVTAAGDAKILDFAHAQVLM